MEYEERAEYVAVRANVPKPGTQKPSYMPPPPPNQPPGVAHRISFEPPSSLGREIKDFTLVSKPAYLKFCRDVDQFCIEHDSMDSRFCTNVQADIFTTVIVPKGLPTHIYVDLEHIRSHPVKYPGAIELIESFGLDAPVSFHHDYNHAAINQFYATCFFGPDKTITWMTSDTKLTASFAQSNPNHAPKNIEACGYLLKPITELDEVEKGKDLNLVSIWRSPFFIIYQCVIRTVDPKMGDKGSCNGYCIDLMYRLYEHPNGKINVPHFLWHEIRLASPQYKRAFPHAPFL